MAAKANRTVRIRIAVVMDAAGNWSAAGASGMSDREAMEINREADDINGLHHACFVEVSIPLPQPLELVGVVVQ